MSGRVYFAAMLILALAACRGVTDEPTGEGYQELRSDKIMIDATHNATNNGVRSAIGQYDTVYVFDDSTVYHVKGVNLQTFDADGRHSSTITADSGSLNQATDALIARGNVVLVTANLCTISTEELNYDPGTRQLWSELPTRFEWDGRVTTADRFRADDGFRNINATNVRGQMPSAC